MKTKLIVLLAAAALVLPAIAGAAVNGPCVNCHTMHDSQNGIAVNPSGQNGQLLRGDGCIGCHATAEANLATGLATSAPFAPQVNDSTNPNAAGYFAVGTQSQSARHNVADFAAETSDSVMTGAGASNGPGGTFVLDNAGSPVLTCDACHSNPVHHNITGGTYRGLSATGFAAFQSDASDYGNLQNSATGIGETSTGVYDADQMNAVCAECHPNFHGGGNQNSIANGAGVWERHPTDIDVLTTAGPSIAADYPHTGDSDAVTVGTEDGTTGGYIMCITCHAAHGSDYADLLKFDYAANLAGGSPAVATTGCETCHSYGSGM